MLKRAPESHKRAKKICIEFNAKQLKSVIFIQASLKSIAPKMFKVFFPLVANGLGELYL